MSTNADGISSGIHIVGQAIKVVEHDGLTIEEIIGNVATRNDDASLALVSITNTTCEPWLTLHYDEWIHVLEGYIELLHHNDENVSNNDNDGDVAKRSPMKTVVREGQTVFIPKNSRMQPVFPVPAKYIPLCIPAFSPDRCIREEGTEGKMSSVSARLNDLHQSGQSATDTLPSSAEEVNEQFKHIQTIYHMCQKSLHDKSISSQTAYFPPTFIQDGRFTHASANPATLLTTANHFYSATSPANEEWICLEIDREVLEKKLGIVTLFECAKAVGDIDTDEDWRGLVFPHIFGGIPVHLEGVVTNIYNMVRSDDGSFLSIDGLVD